MPYWCLELLVIQRGSLHLKLLSTYYVLGTVKCSVIILLTLSWALLFPFYKRGNRGFKKLHTFANRTQLWVNWSWTQWVLRMSIKVMWGLGKGSGHWAPALLYTSIINESSRSFCPSGWVGIWGKGACSHYTHSHALGSGYQQTVPDLRNVMLLGWITAPILLISFPSFPHKGLLRNWRFLSTPTPLP